MLSLRSTHSFPPAWRTRLKKLLIGSVVAKIPYSTGTILFLAVATLLPSFSFALPPMARIAMNNAAYQSQIVEVTPMLFHRIEAGINYDSVLNTIGRSAAYCSSTTNQCSAENGSVSRDCLNNNFIHSQKSWMCHWDGTQAGNHVSSQIEIWFFGDLVDHVIATTEDGTVYSRDSQNAVSVEKNGVRLTA